MTEHASLTEQARELARKIDDIPQYLNVVEQSSDLILAALRRVQQVTRERDAQFVEDLTIGVCARNCLHAIAAAIRSQEEEPRR